MRQAFRVIIVGLVVEGRVSREVEGERVSQELGRNSGYKRGGERKHLFKYGWVE